MFEARGLAKLGGLPGDNLVLSSWWNVLAEKLDDSVIMDLVEDMATDAKRKMRPNTFGMPFTFLYFSLSIILLLNSEMWRFAYYGIRREDYEGKLCTSPLSKSNIDVSKFN